MFFRRRFNLALLPIQHLSSCPEEDGKWYALDDSPLFEIGGNLTHYPGGWVHLGTSLKRKGFDFTACLMVRCKASSAGVLEIQIPATRKGRVNHVFRLPADVSGFHWAPMRSEGIIVHGPIVITEIGQIERMFRMFTWVAHDLWKFRHSRQAERHGLSVPRLLFDLQGAYDASSKLRFNFAPPSYATFVQVHDAVHSDDASAIGNHIAEFKCTPHILIWASVDSDLSIAVFKCAIERLREQFYPNWGLMLVACRPFSTEWMAAIDLECSADQRITLLSAVSDRSDVAKHENLIAKMPGDFVVEMDLMDHWPPHALYHVALEINEHPDVDLLYADEDCLSQSGQRRLPYFKSDWNPELFYSRNLFGNFVVYRRGVLEDAGGFGSNYPAARRLDLALRCLSRTSPQNIRHIPFVLCHRGQSAEWEERQPYAYDAVGMDALAAMQAHFSCHVGVRVEAGLHRGTFRVRYPIPDPAPLVSLLIPTRDALEVLQKCIQSVLAHTTYPNWEIIVLDNQTTDEAALRYLAEIAADPRIRVVRYDLPFNYSAINNFGVGLARGEIIGLLNNDVEVIHADWLTEMVSHVVRPEIGAVGAKLLYSDGYLQHAGVVVGLGGLAGHVHRFIPRDHPGYAGLALLTQAFSAVTAACLLVRKELYLAVGGLDEINLTVAYNDVDLCLRIRDAGFRNVWTPHALLYHHESYSRGDDQESPAKRARFEAEKAYMLKRWHTDTEPDPFYSPNLTTDKEDYSIAHVPRVVKPWLAYQVSPGMPKNWRHRFFGRGARFGQSRAR